MLYAAYVDDDNRELFSPVIEDDTADVLIGLLDDETNKACGVLGAESVADGEDGHGLDILFISIAEGYEGRDGEKILVTFLMDLAVELECSAVSCTGVFEDGDDNSKLLTSLGFYPEEEKLSRYSFLLSDISVEEPKSELGCRHLSELDEDQWEDFLYETYDSGMVVTEPGDYDKDISVFLVDDVDTVQATILMGKRDTVLFVEGVAAYGSDEEALVNDLIFWSTDSAKRSFSGDTELGIFLPVGRIYRDIIMAKTDNKAKKTGSLMTYTFETPMWS